ncbi:MAG TPA: hypothetical protein PL045_00635 [Chitinophagaceae bacterium]|nr:hypothetical protein [Chitinophagaceae bacterium]
MTRHNKHTKAVQTNQSKEIQHTEIFDDNLLPDAAEIQKLHAIDSNILHWLKERAEAEQKFRHEAFSRRVEITNAHDKREHHTARYALTIYLVLVAGCMTAAFFLIRDGYNLQGSLFGGTGIILALAVLVAKRTKSFPDSKQSQTS